MTSITITVDTARKRLKFGGDRIAAGERVEIFFDGTYKPTATTRLRVMANDRLVALFPREDESWEEPVLDLNSNIAQILIRYETDCHFLLEDTDTPQLLGVGCTTVLPWHKVKGLDEPYSLKDYPDRIMLFEEELNKFRDEIVAAKNDVKDAKNAASEAKEFARTAQDSAESAVTSARNAEGLVDVAKENAENAARSAGEAAMTLAGVDEKVSSANEAASTASLAAKSAENVANLSKTELSNHKNDFDNPHKVSASDVGLGNVDNTSDRDKPVSNLQRTAIDKSLSDAKSYAGNQVNAEMGRAQAEEARILSLLSEKQGTLTPAQLAKIENALTDPSAFDRAGTAEAIGRTKADLVDGKVPAAQLPSYVDDVIEFNSKNEFPRPGDNGKIYVANDVNKTYRWSGSDYVEIGGGVSLGETSLTAHRGDHGKIAYDHSQKMGEGPATDANPHGTTGSDITAADGSNTTVAAELERKVAKLDSRDIFAKMLSPEFLPLENSGTASFDFSSYSVGHVGSRLVLKDANGAVFATQANDGTFGGVVGVLFGGKASSATWKPFLIEAAKKSDIPDVVAPSASATEGQSADAKVVGSVLKGFFRDDGPPFFYFDEYNRLHGNFISNGVFVEDYFAGNGGAVSCDGVGKLAFHAKAGLLVILDANGNEVARFVKSTDLTDATKLTPVFSEWTLGDHAPGMIIRNISATYDEVKKGWETTEELSSDGGQTWNEYTVLADENPDPDKTATSITCISATFVRTIIGYTTVNGENLMSGTDDAKAALFAGADFKQAVADCFDNADTTRY